MSSFMHRPTLLALAALAAGGFAAAAGAQQPAGEGMARPQAPAQQPGAGNDAARNQAANPADTGDTGAMRSSTGGTTPSSELTLDRFNNLDRNKDGVLSAAELRNDKVLAARFAEMDTDKNREIDDVEFMGFKGTTVEPGDR